MFSHSGQDRSYTILIISSSLYKTIHFYTCSVGDSYSSIAWSIINVIAGTNAEDINAFI